MALNRAGQGHLLARVAHQSHSCQQLVLIREFDERAGWLKWRCTGCRHWLHWRLGHSTSAAVAPARIARVIKKLPLTSAAFEIGQSVHVEVASEHGCDHRRE